jgi:hypothetical protein
MSEKDKDKRKLANETSGAPTKTPAAVPCPDCGGSGRVVLLISSRVCGRCGGAGRQDAAGGAAERTVEAPDGSTRTYDGHGRLTRAAWPGKPELLAGPDSARSAMEAVEERLGGQGTLRGSGVLTWQAKRKTRS